MDDAFMHFQAARETFLSDAERAEIRADLAMFCKTAMEADPVELALRELGDFALPMIDKLEVRASLRASMTDVEEPVVAVRRHSEMGFVSMFSSMLNQRTPVLA